MENTGKWIEILQAFKEGKCLEYKINHGPWCDWTGVPTHLFEKGYNYRIKKEPTYRPYANAEEFLKASKEHGPYLEFIQKDDKGFYRTHVLPIAIRGVWVEFGKNIVSHSGKVEDTPFNQLIHTYKWSDGSVCGILEQ